jgi:hypothetical protein
MNDTPETDLLLSNQHHDCVPFDDSCGQLAELCRKLERERDEAIQQLEVGHVLNSGLSIKLEQYQRNLELIAEDCESWLNSENDEPSVEFIKLVAKYAREAIK